MERVGCPRGDAPQSAECTQQRAESLLEWDTENNNNMAEEQCTGHRAHGGSSGHMALDGQSSHATLHVW